MPKPKLADFKHLINEMTEAELREELLKLFNKLEQVQTFYAQDLLTKEDRQKILQEAKDKIYKKFWTPSGNPRNNVSNAEIRTYIFKNNLTIQQFNLLRQPPNYQLVFIK